MSSDLSDRVYDAYVAFYNEEDIQWFVDYVEALGVDEVSALLAEHGITYPSDPLDPPGPTFTPSATGPGGTYSRTGRGTTQRPGAAAAYDAKKDEEEREAATVSGMSKEEFVSTPGSRGYNPTSSFYDPSLDDQPAFDDVDAGIDDEEPKKGGALMWIAAALAAALAFGA